MPPLDGEVLTGREVDPRRYVGFVVERRENELVARGEGQGVREVTEELGRG